MIIYEFDRYINGRLMAEGVTVERAKTFEEAMVTAARIASRGPNREVPVLVLRHPTPEPRQVGEPIIAELETLWELGQKKVDELIERWSGDKGSTPDTKAAGIAAQLINELTSDVLVILMKAEKERNARG